MTAKKQPGALLAATVIALSLLAAPALAAEGHGGNANAPSFLKLEALNLTVFDRGAARGRFSLELRLEIVQKTATARVESLKPRLQDGYVAAINEYTSRAGDRVPDLDYLVDQLQKVTDQVLGKPDIAKVLVHSAVRML